MVVMKLKKLKIYKSPGPDGLHSRVLNELADTISIPLSTIFKTSRTTGTLPTAWKNANTSAIHKKGNKEQAQIYRPVSLTSVIGNILEEIIRDTIIHHMNNNDLLSNKQLGFIKGRSTVLQLLKVPDIWTETIDNGGCVDVIYGDLHTGLDCSIADSQNSTCLSKQVLFRLTRRNKWNTPRVTDWPSTFYHIHKRFA